MSETGLDLSTQVGVSGAFLRDESRFSEIRDLFDKYDRVVSKLGEIECELAGCNDPRWLEAFRVRCWRSNL